jgi:hypothetical protein
MSDRPSAVNGKRNQDWGTLGACPACGQCLCFGCHPAGPCVDEPVRHGPFADGEVPAGFTTTAPAGLLDGSWLARGTSVPAGGAGLRMRAPTVEERLR